MGAGDQVGIALPLQLPDNGGADHSAVAGDVDFCVFLHHNLLSASFKALSRFASALSCFAMIDTS